MENKSLMLKLEKRNFKFLLFKYILNYCEDTFFSNTTTLYIFILQNFINKILHKTTNGETNEILLYTSKKGSLRLKRNF